MKKTSDLLVADIRDTVSSLSDNEATWQSRKLETLMALLPMVIFLENAKIDVQPIDVLDFNKIEPLFFMCSAMGHGGKVAASKFEKLLPLIPGHQPNRIAEQSGEAAYQHFLILASCKKLLKATPIPPFCVPSAKGSGFSLQ
jgi:hypothetical protein